MNYRTVGTSGLKVSLVGLGCNNFGERLGLEATRKVVHRALDRGITLFDTADIYGKRGGSETLLGEVLGARRNDIVLLTKFGKPMDDDGAREGGSSRYVMEAVEASLKRLRTDRIDIYMMHAPDPATPMDETMRALDDLVRQGKVLHLGCSNFSAGEIAGAAAAARAAGGAPFICFEDEYSLLERRHERDLFPAAEAHGLGLLPYFPLAGGMLTGKYRQGEAVPANARLSAEGPRAVRFRNPANLARVEALAACAAARGCTLLDLAMSWLAAHPLVSSVIAGATSPEQVDANVAATGRLALSPDEREAIGALCA